jgi:hypothetical protein
MADVGGRKKRTKVQNVSIFIKMNIEITKIPKRNDRKQFWLVQTHNRNQSPTKHNRKQAT